MRVLIRRAGRNDVDRLRDFLGRASLGTDGLNVETVDCFLLMEDENRGLKGTLGMEVFGEAGLLLSLVVSQGQADQDILILMEQMVKLAKEKGLKSLFLATNKNVAVPFFEWLGFAKLGREKLPPELYGSEHIRHLLNVDNSLFLRFTL